MVAGEDDGKPGRWCGKQLAWYFGVLFEEHLCAAPPSLTRPSSSVGPDVSASSVVAAAPSVALRRRWLRSRKGLELHGTSDVKMSLLLP